MGPRETGDLFEASELLKKVFGQASGLSALPTFQRETPETGAHANTGTRERTG